MVEYQNIFTQVQVQGPPEMGVEEGVPLNDRTIQLDFQNCWAGLGMRSLVQFI